MQMHARGSCENMGMVVKKKVGFERKCSVADGL